MISPCRYRAPECLLTDGHYSYKMDMWSVGCVMYEVLRSVYRMSCGLDYSYRTHEETFPREVHSAIVEVLGRPHTRVVKLTPFLRSSSPVKPGSHASMG